MKIPENLSADETKSRISQMIEKQGKDFFVSFATFGDIYPAVRVMLVAAHDGIDVIWFATEADSEKIAQLRKNPKASIYAFIPEPMEEFRLFGNVELLTDSASRQKVWRDDFVEFWTDGVDSPAMIVLRFNTESGLYTNYDEIGRF